MVEARSWTFSVGGMHCAKCIRKIQESSKSFPEVRDLKISFADSSLKFSASEDFSADLYAEKIRKAGFEVRLVSENENTAQYSKKTDKWFLARIAVAGACAGNIMLLSISSYSSSGDFEFAKLFAWISFGLFLPILLFSAQPILKNALSSIKYKRLSVDTPLALAIFGSFLLSTYSLIRDSDQIYFDSLSMFVFFLMASRYFIYRLQLKYLSPVNLSDLFQKQSIELIDGTFINIKKIKAGDIFKVKAGQYLPVDAQVMNDLCEFDNSIVTGESFPIRASKFDKLSAGAKLISKEASFKAVSTLSDSKTYRLVEKINNLLNQESYHTQLVDKGAHYLTIAIIALASSALFYFAFTDLQTGLERVLALLVVACPCGLAIATPLAHSLSVKKALSAGIIIKDIKALEELPHCRALVFDKTGTLTSGELLIHDWHPVALTAEEKQVLFNLEVQSEHPIAKAILRNVGPQAACKMTNLTEFAGQGVSADYKGDRYLVRTQQVGTSYQVQLIKNEEVIKFATITDSLPVSSKDQMSRLKKLGYQIYILSGDHTANTLKLGNELGINESHIYANQNPDQKLKVLNKLKAKYENVFYIGDGINDALSLASATVSASTHTSANIAFKSASVHFLKPGIQSISQLIDIAKANLLAVRGNILLSFVYNSIFAALALLGFISPLLAVILMPLSSLATVFWSLYAINRKVLP